ncbi:MAG: NAD-dependent epimerase/dehydratase family protein [Gammaproteobacteria bacterium]|nr:MAG: NAD-dependent epimerase/dehydratase family protein [Gammaproteobacteria bacterium]
MLRVAITGATGFVGQALCNLLNETPAIKLTLLGRHNPQQYLDFINIETDSATIAQQLYGYDCIIHLAARAHTQGSSKTDFERDNIELTKKLIAISLGAKITQFIYLSSVKVLGNKTQPGHPFRVYDTPAPEDDYGRSKWECEKLLIANLSNTSTAYTIIRPPLVWGVNVKGNLKTLIKLINKGIPLPFGSIHNRRDVVSLTNLTHFIKHTMLNPKSFNDTFLISDGKSLSTPEIIYLLQKLSTKKARIIRCPRLLFSIAKLIPSLKARIESFSDNLEVDISSTSKKLEWMPLN